MPFWIYQQPPCVLCCDWSPSQSHPQRDSRVGTLIFKTDLSILPSILAVCDFFKDNSLLNIYTNIPNITDGCFVIIVTLLWNYITVRHHHNITIATISYQSMQPQSLLSIFDLCTCCHKTRLRTTAWIVIGDNTVLSKFFWC